MKLYLSKLKGQFWHTENLTHVYYYHYSYYGYYSYLELLGLVLGWCLDGSEGEKLVLVYYNLLV